MPETPIRQLAADKRRAREQRIRDLRTRVVALAVALFVAVWSGLYIQLVSGHDPALAGEATPVTQSAATERRHPGTAGAATTATRRPTTSRRTRGATTAPTARPTRHRRTRRVTTPRPPSPPPSRRGSREPRGRDPAALRLLRRHGRGARRRPRPRSPWRRRDERTRRGDARPRDAAQPARAPHALRPGLRALAAQRRTRDGRLREPSPAPARPSGRRRPASAAAASSTRRSSTSSSAPATRARAPGVPASSSRTSSRAAGRRGRHDPRADDAWRRIVVDDDARTITRPPWLRIDSGGLGKGLAADLVANALRGHAVFAVDCCGDVRIGGRARVPRRVLVEHPAGGDPMHELTDRRRRRRDERRHAPQLARRDRRRQAPPARSVHRPAGVDRRRPGDRARPDRARSGDPREGRAARRAHRAGCSPSTAASSCSTTARRHRRRAGGAGGMTGAAITSSGSQPRGGSARSCSRASPSRRLAMGAKGPLQALGAAAHAHEALSLATLAAIACTASRCSATAG